MNAQRRKVLKEVSAKLAEALSLLETIAEDEREAFDNLPESLQDGKGDAADIMEAAVSELEGVIDSLEECG